MKINVICEKCEHFQSWNKSCTTALWKICILYFVHSYNTHFLNYSYPSKQSMKNMLLVYNNHLSLFYCCFISSMLEFLVVKLIFRFVQWFSNSFKPGHWLGNPKMLRLVETFRAGKYKGIPHFSDFILLGKEKKKSFFIHLHNYAQVIGYVQLREWVLLQFTVTGCVFITIHEYQILSIILLLHSISYFCFKKGNVWPTYSCVGGSSFLQV